MADTSSTEPTGSSPSVASTPTAAFHIIPPVSLALARTRGQGEQIALNAARTDVIDAELVVANVGPSNTAEPEKTGHRLYDQKQAAQVLRVPIDCIQDLVSSNWLTTLQCKGNRLISHDALVSLARQVLPAALEYLGADSTVADSASPLNSLPIDDIADISLREIDRVRHHEAGHAVADYLYRFQPLRIIGPISWSGCRAEAFFKTPKGSSSSPSVRHRAQDYAVCVLAGIAAESKFRGIPFAKVRRTTGAEDYRTVNLLLDLLMYGALESSPKIRARHLRLLEARAIELMDQPGVWAAVKSVCQELEKSGGRLERRELVGAIERSFRS